MPKRPPPPDEGAPKRPPAVGWAGVPKSPLEPEEETDVALNSPPEALLGGRLAILAAGWPNTDPVGAAGWPKTEVVFVVVAVDCPNMEVDEEAARVANHLRGFECHVPWL